MLKYIRYNIPYIHSMPVDFSEERLVQTVNDELVNTLCNLLSRCCSIQLNPGQQVVM